MTDDEIFMSQIRFACDQLHKQYPTLNAYKDKTTGDWTLHGPFIAQIKFRDICEALATRLGRKGSQLEKVQWVLRGLNGELTSPTPPKSDMDPYDQREIICTNPDGTIEAYRGRQRIG